MQFCSPTGSLSLRVALTLAALALSACAERGPAPVSTLGEDDDAICRANNVAPGSTAYIGCRKDRDRLRDNAAADSTSRQRKLGEYMINHPN
jgi:hypothetical protein